MVRPPCHELSRTMIVELLNGSKAKESGSATTNVGL
jgi:hypothetical protein